MWEGISLTPHYHSPPTSQAPSHFQSAVLVILTFISQTFHIHSTFRNNHIICPIKPALEIIVEHKSG